MRVVSAADVTRLLPVPDAIPLLAHAFRLFSAGTGVYPLRTHVRLHNPSGDALVMPAYDGTDGLGVKLVTVHPQSADDITVFNPVGLAVRDVVAAMEIYRRARQHDIGTDVAL